MVSFRRPTLGPGARSSRRPAAGRVVLAACVLATVSGCGISPKPEPPHTEAPVVEPDLVVSAPPATFGDLLLRGLAGAVEPAEGIVRAYNLESTDPAAEATVQSDGSFELGLLGQTGDEVRLQVIGSRARSTPADFVVGPVDTTVTPATRPLGDCLLIDPAAELELAPDTPALVEIRNSCGVEVQLLAPAVRVALAGLTVGQELSWPRALSPEDNLSVDIEFASSETVNEEIVFIEATAPEPDRRPLTVRRVD